MLIYFTAHNPYLPTRRLHQMHSIAHRLLLTRQLSIMCVPRTRLRWNIHRPTLLSNTPMSYEPLFFPSCKRIDKNSPPLSSPRMHRANAKMQGIEWRREYRFIYSTSMYICIYRGNIAPRVFVMCCKTAGNGRGGLAGRRAACLRTLASSWMTLCMSQLFGRRPLTPYVSIRENASFYGHARAPPSSRCVDQPKRMERYASSCKRRGKRMRRHIVVGWQKSVGAILYSRNLNRTESKGDRWRQDEGQTLICRTRMICIVEKCKLFREGRKPPRQKRRHTSESTTTEQGM